MPKDDSVKKQLRSILVWASMALSLSLGGCAIYDWFSDPPPRNPPAELVQFSPSKTPHRLWSVNVGSARNYVFEPAVVFDAVYAAAADGTVVRVDPSNGAEVWRRDVDTDLTTGVATDGNTVVVAGVKGSLIALDSGGNEKWKVPVSTEILTTPIIAHGLVVVRSMDNKISAYDVDTGERRWIVPYRAPALMLRASPGIATVGPTVIVALPGGRMISMMINTGAIRWEIPIGDPKGATELERIADMSGTPAIYGQGVCVAAYQGRMGCFDVVSGSTFWVKGFSSKVGVSIDEEHVYAVDTNDKVYAFSNLRGQSVWRNDKMTYRSLTTPVPYRSDVAVGDGQGFIHFLSRYDGSFDARIETDGSPILATPVVMGERLIVQTRDGSLQAFTLD